MRLSQISEGGTYAEQAIMKHAFIVVLVLFAAPPVFAKGHGAGSTAPMCSTCGHRQLCRADQLFSCHKSRPQSNNLQSSARGGAKLSADR